MHFIEQCYSRDPTNWWIPNRACAEAMLRSAGFEMQNHPEPEVFICRPVPIEDGEARAVYPAGGARTR
jgi:tRNA (mo5U34)-methyltransferase